MQTLKEILREHLCVLDQHCALTPAVLATLDASIDWDGVKLPPDVTAFDDLKTYFALIDGDEARAGRLLAWGMQPLSLAESLQHHDMAGEHPDYWPSGFLPFLQDGGGSYVVINCRATSPTFRAVYDMSEGVGCTRLANSLSEFFAASTREIALGLRNYSEVDSPTISTREYLAKAAPLFGNSPYFDRERMDQSIVDWETAVVPLANKRRTATPAAPLPASPEIVSWAKLAGVAAPVEDGSYLIKLSTAPVEHWFFKRSKLTPQTTTIEANIRHTSWTVKLTREDRLFFVIWSSGGKLSVTSDQLKYQRLVRWPALDAIETFPKLVQQLESLLGFRFIPYADVTVPYTETQATLANPQLLAWLAPCAKKVGRYVN
jgi:hypothetical protein